MSVSIASYSFHGLLAEKKMDVFGYLESCRFRYDVQAADIWSGMLPSLDEEFLTKVREAMDEKEMYLANLCVDGPHLWDDDPAVREDHYQKALEYINAAELLGAETLRIDMGVRSDSLTAEQLDYLAAKYREYCERCADFGCKMGPETHWGASLYVDVQQAVHDAVDHPGYGVLLHIGHFEGGPAEQERGDRTLAPWAIHTHVDAKITATCLKEKMQLLLDAGYAGCWGVEHHSAKNEYAEVAWQLASVRRELAHLG